MTDITDVAFRTVLGLLGAGMLFVAGCRVKHTSKVRTLARIRAAIVVMGTAGGLLIIASTVRPDLLQLAGAAGPTALLGWMAATAHAWRDRQPLSATIGGAVLRSNRRAWTASSNRSQWGDDPPTVPMTERDRRRVMEG